MEPRAPRLALLALALALALPHLGWACSPPADRPYVAPNTEEKIHFSDVVVHGRVTRHLGKSDSWPDTAYSVEMQVLCIFKSPPDARIPSKITIINAGFVPGLCHSTNLTEGKEYVVYLNIVDDKYEPGYSQSFADPQFIEDIPFFCEVSIISPYDSDPENNSCPPIYDDYDNCMAYEPPTDSPVVSPPIPPQPEPSDKPYPEPGPVKTTPKTQVQIVSSDTMADEQGHSIHTHHTPTNGDNGADGGDNSEETVAVAGYKDNGSDVPLLSSLLVAACLLVALAAKG